MDDLRLELRELKALLQQKDGEINAELSTWAILFGVLVMAIVLRTTKQMRREMRLYWELKHDLSNPKNMLREFIGYRLDCWLSSQASARVILLLLATLFLICFGGIILFVVHRIVADPDGPKA